MLKIDKGIPPPKRKARAVKSAGDTAVKKPSSERQETIIALKVGESFFMAGVGINSAGGLRWWANAYCGTNPDGTPKRHFVSATRTEDGVKGVRTWRVRG